MKKFILGFIVIISFLSFNYQYVDFNNALNELYTREVFRVGSTYPNTVDIMLYENTLLYDSFDEQIELLLQYADEHDYMLTANLAIEDEMNRIIETYTYVLNKFEAYELLAPYYYTNEVIIDSDLMISTVENALYRYKYFDHTYYNPYYTSSLTLMFSDNLDFVKNLDTGTMHFSLHYKDGVKPNIENDLIVLFEDYVEYYGDFNAGNHALVFDQANDVSTLLLYLSILMLSILLIVYVLNKERAVAISKMQGNANLSITYHEYGKLLLTTCGIFVLSLIIQYIFRVHDYTYLGFMFMEVLFPQVLILVWTSLVLFTILYVYVTNFRFIQVLRKDSKNISMFGISSLLKIILFVLLANPILQLVNNMINTYYINQQINKYTNFYDDYLIIDYIQNDFQSLLYELELELSEYLTTKGAIYASSLQIDTGGFLPHPCRVPELNTPLPCDQGINLEKYPNIYPINENFLHLYTNLTFKNDDAFTIFIPENKVNEFDLQNFKNSDIEIIVIENGIILPILEITVPRVSPTVEDAILFVSNRNSVIGQMFIPKDFDFNDPIFLELIGDRKYTYYPASAKINSITEYQNALFVNDLQLFIVYIVLMIVYLYQFVFLYFYTNKKELSINYFLGKSYIEQYYPLFTLTIMIFIIIAAILFFRGLSLFHAFLYCSSFFVLDSILLVFMIKYFDSKTIPTVLKGDE